MKGNTPQQFRNFVILDESCHEIEPKVCCVTMDLILMHKIDAELLLVYPTN